MGARITATLRHGGIRAAVVAGVAVVGLTGCGGPASTPPHAAIGGGAGSGVRAVETGPVVAETTASGSATPSAVTTSVPTSASAPTPSADVTPPVNPPPSPTNAPACDDQHLVVRLIHQPSVNQGAMALLALTNTEPLPCTLSGWPTVELTSGALTLPVPATNVDEPRPPVTVVLRGYRSAFAGIRWRSCSAAARRCHAGDGLRVTIPGSEAEPARLIGFPGHGRRTLEMRSMEIGAIQATTTDIITW